MVSRPCAVVALGLRICRDLQSLAVALCVLGALAALYPTRASATCLNPRGDVNGNGVTNVADAQCSFLGVLWQVEFNQAGSPKPVPPSCAFGGAPALDSNCDGQVLVSDSQIVVWHALGLSLPSIIDADGNGCVDTCDAAVALCGNGVQELGEECDDGFANNDTLADFCRTNCKLPSCGDSVVDTGEACDDGNATGGDGCEPDCSLSGNLSLALPYLQSFNSGNLGSLGWAAESDAGSASNNWTLSPSGPLGPDVHPRFFYLPTVTNYTDRLVSPRLDATGATFVTLRFDSAIALGANPTAATTFRVQASANDGQNWTTVWERTGADGPQQAQSALAVDLTGVAAGSDQVRVSFVIAGPTTAAITYWEVDQVDVRAGSPPVLASIPNVSVQAGGTANAPVSATDLDTAGADLVFSLSGAPAWVQLTSNGDGTAALSFNPPAGPGGVFNNVTVTVSDGTFSASRTFSITVVADPSNTPAYITIRNQAGGGGAAVDTLSLQVGQTSPMFAASYSSTGVYLGDVAAVWTRTGTISAPSASASPAIVYAPTLVGTGFITATPTNASIAPDSTGTITVTAPAAGIDLGLSAVTVAPQAIEANGTSTAVVSVSVFNTQGAPVTDATVVLQATAGTLQGSVVNAGNGVYTQTIQSAASVGVASITATINAQALPQAALLQFVNFFLINSATTIDCDNYATWQGRSLTVASTLTINSNPTAANPQGCAPMQFGDVIVTTGNITHSAATAAAEFFTDIQVNSLLVQSGGQMNFTGRGYLGGINTSVGGRTLGNTTALGAPTNVGGSHGGFGGSSNATRVYGSLWEPRTLGGGGGFHSTAGAGGAGGGAVRVVAAQAIVIHGNLFADGAQGPGGAGCGGAGGSIWLQAPSISGTGNVTANGGAASTASGAGGRIAITEYQALGGSFALATLPTKIIARSGASGTRGGAGTIFVKGSSQTYGSLLVHNQNQSAVAGSTPIPLVPQGFSTGVGASTLEDLGTQWATGRFAGSWVNPNVDQPGAATGLSTQSLFRIVSHDANLLQLQGTGQVSEVAQVPDTYRGVAIFDTVDVLGLGRLQVDGDLWVLSGSALAPAAGTLQVNGHLQAGVLDLGQTNSVELSNGTLSYSGIFGSQTPSFPFNFKLSSSATVASPELDAALVECNSSTVTSVLRTTSDVVSTSCTFSGASMQVQGNATFTSGTVSSGSVQVEGVLTATSTTFSVAGDVSADEIVLTSPIGAVGTTGTKGSVTINNGMLSATSITSGDDLTLDGNAQLTITGDTVAVADRLDLKGTSILWQTATPSGGAIPRLDISANVVLVAASCRIDASGQGFRGSPGSGNAYTNGNVTTLGAPANVGGSYGGQGGSSTAARVYGSVFFPDHAGGGGGLWSSNSNPGGHGGGIIAINAPALVRVDGAVWANGANAPSSQGGGGAGGTVRIHTTHLSGTGSIRANGGSSSNTGGGAGGRIAVLGLQFRTAGFADNNVYNAIQSRGGSGANTTARGGAGTIFLKLASETYGDLIVDNGGNVSADRSTPLRLVPEGVALQVQGNQLTAGGVGWTPDDYAGSWVNPNIAQNGVSAPLVGQTFYYINSHTFQTLTVAPASNPLATKAAAGDSFRGVLPLRRLELRGRSNLWVQGDVMVLSGGIDSPAGQLQLGGVLEANLIDINNITVISASGGGIKGTAVYTQGGTSTPLTVSLVSSSTLDLPALIAGSLTATSSTVTIGGPLTVNGGLTLSSTQLTCTNATVGGSMQSTAGTFTANSLNVGGSLSSTNTSYTVGPMTVGLAASFSGGTLNIGAMSAQSGAFASTSATLSTLAIQQDLDISGNTVLTMNDTVVTAGGSVTVRDTANLTHCATSPVKECRLEVTAQSVLVASGALIDVSARGYTGSTGSGTAYTSGNVTTLGASANQGGSHGGLGGSAPAGRAYGELRDPRSLGGGGGHWSSNSTAGGNGGGAIRIVASSFVAVDGAIRANGQAGVSNQGGGGAGGSINIHTPNLGGNGSINTIGGFSSNSGGGSGGRIALRGLQSLTGVFAGEGIYNAVRAQGANNNGGAGTIFVQRVGQLYGDLIVDNNNISTSNYGTPVALLPQGTATSATANALTSVGSFWQNNVYRNTHVNPNIAQAGAANGLASQSIYFIAGNTTDTLSLAGSPAVNTVAPPGSTYRGVLALDNLEVRRRGRLEVLGDLLVLSGDLSSNNTTTMNLQGAIKANIIDFNTVNQVIASNIAGLEATAIYYAGAQNTPVAYDLTGGTWSLPDVVASSFSLASSATFTTPSLTVSGNLTTNASVLNAGPVTVSGQVSATGGTWNVGTTIVGNSATFTNTAWTGGNTTVAGALSVSGGTTVAGAVAAQSVLLSGGTQTFSTLTATTGIEIAGATTTINDINVVAGTSLVIKPSGRLQHCDTTTSKVCELLIVAPTVLVESGGFIDANGRGYLGSPGSGNGYTAGNTTTGGASANVGGSHGGRAGSGTVNQVYDSVRDPRLPGGGGGFWSSTSSAGGAGGGVIRIQASSVVSVEGSIQANGAAAVSSQGGGGAGGTIAIQTPQLGGNGTIIANGAASSNSGGGGGGRIAIRGVATFTGNFAGANLLNSVRTFGASGSAVGGAGTVFVQRAGQTFGDLIIDNNNLTTSIYSTPIHLVPQGVSTGIAASSLTAFGANWLSTAWRETHINPNVNQPSAASGLAAQALYGISNNTADSLALTGTPAVNTIAAPGDTYRGVLVLDNLEIRRRGRLEVLGDLLVLSGDISSDDTTTLNLQGAVKAATMDLNNVTDLIASNVAGIEVQSLFSSGSQNTALNYQISGGTWNLPVVNASSLTLSSTTLTTSAVNVTGNIVLTSSSLTTPGSTTVGGNFTATGGSCDLQGVSVAGDLALSGVTFTAGNVAVSGTASISTGTAVVGDLASDVLIEFSGGTQTAKRLLSGGDVVLNASSTTIDETLVQAAGNVLINTSSTLRHCATTASKTCSLDVVATDIFVSAAAFIDNNGLGYLGAPGSGNGYGPGNSTSFGAGTNQGGSHGGLGGSAALNRVYDSWVRPLQPGGGGGFWSSNSAAGGAGGGAVRLNAAGVVTVNGTVRVNGAVGASSQGGGGAGGSILIEAAILGGTGTLQANGAASSNAGGGAGGRISVLGANSIVGNFATNPTAAFLARGASGTAVGGAGTTFIRRAGQTYGDMRIDNNNLTHSPGWRTPIVLLPSTAVTGVPNANTLESFGAFWGANAYVETWVNPNVAQPGSAQGIATQQLFYIASHTGSALTVQGAGDLTDVATPGGTMRGVLALDNLNIRGRGQLDVLGDLWVRNADIDSADATTLNVTGQLRALTMDLGSTTNLVSVTNGGMEAQQLFVAGSNTTPVQWAFASSASVMPAMFATTFASTSSTLTVPSLTVGGAYNQTGGTITVNAGPLVAASLGLAGSATLNAQAVNTATVDATSSTMTVQNLTTTAGASFTSATVTGNILQSAGAVTMQGGTQTWNRVITPEDLVLSGSVALQLNDELVDVGKTLELLDTATLQHCPTTTSKVCRLDVRASSVLIGTSARIDASGRGYVGTTSGSSYSIGNVTTFGAGANQGGSHGGRGGAAAATRVYGNFAQPVEPGGGGGFWSSNSQVGATGGGVVRIVAQASVVVDGSILANGANGVSNESGGGAGGSIWITSPNLGGNGLVEASGGSTSNSGGGAGGRIAIDGAVSLAGIFAPSTLHSKVRAFGRTGTGSNHGGAGTIFLKRTSEQFGSLLINNNGVASVADSTPLLLVPQGTTILSNAATRTITDFGATLVPAHHAGQWVDGQFPGATAPLTGRVLLPVQSHTATTITFGGSTNVATAAPAGGTYRGVLPLNQLTVRGNGRLRVDSDVLVLNGNLGNVDPAPAFDVNGSIWARSLDLTNAQSVQVAVAGITVQELYRNGVADYPFDLTVSGSAAFSEPVVHVNNLTMPSSSTLSATELRVAGDLTATSATLSVSSELEVTGNVTTSASSTTVPSYIVGGDLTATGGTLNVSGALTVAGHLQLPSNGTFTLGDVAAGQYTQTAAAATMKTLTVATDAALNASAALEITQSLVDVGGSFNLNDSSRLRHPPATTSAMFTLDVKADILVIAASAAIDVKGRGYVGSNGAFNARGFGNSTTWGATYRFGGSHGGIGLRGTIAGAGPIVYDSLFDPGLPGGGGGSGQTTGTGGDGGGVVWVETTTALVVNGWIDADGNGGSGTAGGGAGGAIRIVTPSLSGTGTIAARGGNSGDAANAGGGAGGRISIQGPSLWLQSFQLSSIWTKVLANGGTGWSSQRGGAGTIFLLEDGQTDGTLLLDNLGTNSQAHSTPLPGVPQGTVGTPLGATSLFDGLVNWPAGLYAGTWLNPAIDQGNATRLIDDVFVPILANTPQTLTTHGSADLTTLTAVGKTYRMGYRFANLELRGNARLQVPGDILVLEGDLHSNNTTTLELLGSATLDAIRLDRNNATISGGTVTGTVVP